MHDGQLRSFVAIPLPGELKSKIAIFQSGFKTLGFGFVKWVEPESMHLTLKFLGNQNLMKLETVKRVLNTCTAGCKPFTLSTGQIGCFPNYRRIRIFWLGLDGDVDRLLDLQEEIDKALAKEGFPREGRPFTAHLTLARLRDESSPQDRLELAEKIQGASFEPCCGFNVDHIVLMKSTLTPHGPLYTRLSEFKFGI